MEEQPFTGPGNQEQKNNNTGFGLKNIDQKPVRTIKWMVRISNLIAAGLVIGSGISGFSFVAVSSIISSVYVIILGFLLCCFELHLSSMDKFVYENFGFMFYWPGRFVFLAFVGFMSFGLGLLGKIAGGYTVLNIIFNVYVLSVHREYKKYIQQTNDYYQNKAGAASAQEFQVSSAKMSFQDAKKAAAFCKNNKQNVDAAAQFYGENKQAVDAGMKFAAGHTKEIGHAAKASKNAGMW